MKFSRPLIQVARDINRANKRAIRNRERRERELIREQKRVLREEERYKKQFEREEKARNKEEEKAAFALEKDIFEKRVKERRQMRLELINKAR